MGCPLKCRGEGGARVVPRRKGEGGVGTLHEREGGGGAVATRKPAHVCQPLKLPCTDIGHLCVPNIWSGCLKPLAVVM